MSEVLDRINTAVLTFGVFAPGKYEDILNCPEPESTGAHSEPRVGGSNHATLLCGVDLCGVLAFEPRRGVTLRKLSVALLPRSKVALQASRSIPNVCLTGFIGVVFWNFLIRDTRDSRDSRNSGEAPLLMATPLLMTTFLRGVRARSALIGVEFEVLFWFVFRIDARADVDGVLKLVEIRVSEMK